MSAGIIHRNEATVASAEEISAWLQHYFADLKGVSREHIPITSPFLKFGLDSATAVALTGDLMEWLKIDVDPAVLYEHPTIEQVSAHLFSLVKTADK